MKLYHLTALLYVPFAFSCAPQPQSQSNTTLPYTHIAGNDGPANPATQGYFINHVGMLTSDLDRTREWYKTVLGMREVFNHGAIPRVHHHVHGAQPRGSKRYRVPDGCRDGDGEEQHSGYD
jgi:hypothetical protein